jgi:hypothetical protein
MMVCHVPVRGRKQAMNHDTRRSREEATGTPKARQIGAVTSIILIDGASIIVIALIRSWELTVAHPAFRGVIPNA